jgi:hypothetical protein
VFSNIIHYITLHELLDNLEKFIVIDPYEDDWGGYGYNLSLASP